MGTTRGGFWRPFRRLGGALTGPVLAYAIAVGALPALLSLYVLVDLRHFGVHAMSLGEQVLSALAMLLSPVLMAWIAAFPWFCAQSAYADQHGRTGGLWWTLGAGLGCAFTVGAAMLAYLAIMKIDLARFLDVESLGVGDVAALAAYLGLLPFAAGCCAGLTFWWMAVRPRWPRPAADAP